MSAELSQPRIEVGAAKLAATLKFVFASELRKAAGDLATNGEALTADHYRRAIPAAAAKMLQFVNDTREPVDNAQRRVA